MSPPAGAPSEPTGDAVPEHRIEVDDAGSVRVVAFDRPDMRNAFDRAMYEAVTDALLEAQADEAIGAVVLTGRGAAFTSGQDLREMAAIATGEAAPAAGSGFRDFLHALDSMDKPVLAAVHGAAVGLGLTMLGHVDLVLVDETARLRVPFAELGVPPEAASSLLLPMRMGWQWAALALLASEWIDAHQAVAAGLALRVCPRGRVLEETRELAQRITGFPSHGVRLIKRLMTEPLRTDIAAARQREEDAFVALFADPSRNPGAALTAGLES